MEQESKLQGDLHFTRWQYQVKYQDFTRSRWPDQRLDFGGALDLADKVHVLALAVFTVFSVQIENDKRISNSL